jgi:class 3 adenylate cyclase
MGAIPDLIEAAAPTSDESAIFAHTSTSRAERRQSTVVFSDLVGSTALSRQLDPEDLRELMRRYQDAVSGAATGDGGHIVTYLGDGALAYFGWPQTYEDQAERPVQAGLDAVESIEGIRSGVGDALAARNGIATGEVVVGDLVWPLDFRFTAVTGRTRKVTAERVPDTQSGWM